eukprot:489459-Heterocapsa_arctica.AAC.1
MLMTWRCSKKKQRRLTSCCWTYEWSGTSQKGKLNNMGQVRNDSKEQIFMPNTYMEKLWDNITPDYKGKVGQEVVDLGVTHRVHTRA